MSTRPILSSAHLASENGTSLSEFEFALTIANNAFSRWMLHCAKAGGASDMAPLDVLIVHHINHRERAKTLSEICFMLNMEDTHTVNYSLKKLLKKGLIEGEKKGKEVRYKTSREGRKFCVNYRKIREDCLVESLQNLSLSPEELASFAGKMRSLAGLYDQASREVASL
ncbi:transcriptional regulator ['Osedax' symbiont bacterium Rs2_46_30_T18]|nr:transcriptional regulator ['Osedax' symbiont bacterium Rs2_46_30_T18]